MKNKIYYVEMLQFDCMFPYLVSFLIVRLLDIAVYKYEVATEEKIRGCLEKIHVWRPQNLKEIIDK